MSVTRWTEGVTTLLPPSQAGIPFLLDAYL